ncbi:MAG: beta-ketoacyl synthase chain length factor [Proteobacteria bacterium]|nr:beta-ketoacyl synthase chain length factor [Pseudomonadota bacterium]
MSNQPGQEPLRVRIASVGLVGPGLHGWQNSRKYLHQGVSPESREMPLLVPEGISPRERRRLTETIKLALVAGQDALLNLSVPVAIEQLSTVFASANGDLFVADKILSALALPGKPVSPTHFHNSVHNAPAGYWHLASHSMHASTSIAADENSFVSGLLEAVSQVVATAEPCLLVVCDSRAPENYRNQLNCNDSLALALVLQADDGHCIKADTELLEIRQLNPAIATVMDDAVLETMRQGNPAAKGLPLLHLLADPGVKSVIFEGGLAGGIELKRVSDE